MKTSFFKLMAFAGVFALIVSCEKEQPDTDTSTAMDNSVAESEFAQVFPTVNQIAVNEEGVEKLDSASGCATVTVTPQDSGVFPKTMTIDYGAGCIGADSRTRKGKLVATISGPWKSIGTEVTIELGQFICGDVQFAGTMKTKRESVTKVTTSLTGGKATSPAGELKLDYSKTIEWTAGVSTPVIAADDEFTITGTSSGTNRKGKSYSSTIVTPLVKKNSCQYISAGKIDITPDGLSKRTVNFGTGNCDNDAVVTIDGQDYNIKLN